MQIDHVRSVQGAATAHTEPAISLAVGIATSGRARTLGRMLDHIYRQTSQPDGIYVAPISEGDIPESALSNVNITVVRGPAGLTAQRNSILDSVSKHDAVLFLDDDFLMADDYVARARELLTTNPGIVAASGCVIADGVSCAGIDFDRAVDILQEHSNRVNLIIDDYNSYGCNMLIRLEPVFKHGIKFDTELPLYGWLEDVDFGRQLAPFGRIVRFSMLVGVHLGEKAGRTSGVKFGYSQIANPIYLYKKGTLNLGRAIGQVSRNVIKNLILCIKPEPWVDRRGRAKGNLIAATDIVRGKLHPRRIETL